MGGWGRYWGKGVEFGDVSSAPHHLIQWWWGNGGGAMVVGQWWWGNGAGAMVVGQIIGEIIGGLDNKTVTIFNFMSLFMFLFE